MAKSLKVAKGQVLTIPLESGSSTGYKWYLSEIVDTSKLVFIDKKTTRDSDKVIPRLGGNHTEIWSFSATNKGKTTLLFYYKRQWESKKPLDSISYRIKIK